MVEAIMMLAAMVGFVVASGIGGFVASKPLKKYEGKKIVFHKDRDVH